MMEEQNKTPERNLVNELYDQAIEEIGLANFIIATSISLAVAIGTGLSTFALYINRCKK
jgi:hypothetical protein